MNVYEAAINRLEYIFQNFENVYVSFSGGKDSGVLLNLAIKVLEKYEGRKLGVFHMDYECQYQMTTEYVDRVFSTDDGRLEFYRICVPFNVPCTTSIHQSFWRPWNESEREIWVRELPECALTSFPFFRDGMWDYEFQEKFLGWYSQEHGGGSSCALVGIRTTESLNRWRAIHREDRVNTFEGRQWTHGDGNLCTAYPIFDWTTEDVWTANAKFGWDYNRLYDIFYMAGLGIEQMRVASPFIGEGQEVLKLYRVIEPNTWAKMIGRVNGVNFTGIYGGTTAMGWKSIKLPEGHTWKSYMYFLLDTLPNETKASYLDKLATSIRFWKERGGTLGDDVIDKLRKYGIDFELSENNYKSEKKSVRMDYLDDIDIAEFKEIPTYKRMCICIMKNDHLCKYMGFSQTKDEILRRKRIMEKYNSLL